MNEIPVLDDIGFVRLDNHMADDLSVVNAARVSFADRVEAMSERDEGLIRFLMRERHGTPFEHNAFRFHIKAPLFVVREWQRHRIGSFNEQSGRYTEFAPDFYVPRYVRSQVGKPGSYSFEPLNEGTASKVRTLIASQSAESFKAYQDMLIAGVAKEVARMVLPINTYSQFYWTVNLRSLLNFLSLRTADDAQYEIRMFAEAVLRLAKTIMPVTFASWETNDRVVP